jgi:hypothetical protein
MAVDQCLDRRFRALGRQHPRSQVSTQPCEGPHKERRDQIGEALEQVVHARRTCPGGLPDVLDARVQHASFREAAECRI